MAAGLIAGVKLERKFLRVLKQPPGRLFYFSKQRDTDPIKQKRQNQEKNYNIFRYLHDLPSFFHILQHMTSFYR